MNEQLFDSLELVPLSKFNKYYAYPTIGALRQFRFKNTNNFNNKVIKRIQGRLYINVSNLFEWMNAQIG